MLAPKRPLVVSAVSLIFVLILSACGASPQAPSTTAEQGAESPAADSSAAAPASAAADSSGSDAALTMWTWKLSHVPGLEAIAKNFEAETGTAVAVSAYNPDDVYRTKVTTAAQSGDLPDVLSYWSGGQMELAASGLLTELTDKVDDEWSSRFLPGTYELQSVYTQDTFDACAKDPACKTSNLTVGQVYSVPILAGQAFFVYGNKALMREAGLDPNTPPATAEEWLSMMQTIKEKTGTAGVVTGVQNPDVLQYWLFNPLLMASCGQETFDAIYNGSDSFANPCAMKVLNWINELATDELWTPDILQTNIDPADVAFSQGKAAFDIGGTYTLSFLLAQGMKADDILSFPIPPLEGSQYPKLEINTAPLIDVMITKDSQHPDEALAFLKFMTQPEQMALFAKTVGDLPAVKVPADADQVGDVMLGLVQALSDDSPFSDSKAQQLEEPSKVLKLGLQQFISGETAPDALAAEVDTANAAAWAERGGPLK